ncbi:hypothetical protein ACTFRP_18625 [Bacillus cereus group sp. MYBK234-1]|uniref:hypothetical protein n=1 Tax=unclassified Bacillus cereus group TaxID=2750818 RepID=UPI003F7B0067
MKKFQSKMVPQMVALTDYQNNKQLDMFSSPLSLSSISFPIYKLKPFEYIVSMDSENVLDFLSSSDERVWFMMNGELPKGLIIANNMEPIRMGGENRSKDLYQMYQSISNVCIDINEISYIEFEGQSLFRVSHYMGEDIYLSQGASDVLDLPYNQKISVCEFIKKMKKRIGTFN